MNDLGGKSAPRLAAGQVSFFQVGEEEAGQRIDNFLLRLARGVPKSHIYRVIRGGEVRVNRKRIDADYRLAEGDEVRLPPMRTAERAPVVARAAHFPVIHEDGDLLVIDKPAGVAVHGGSGVAFGVVEQLRAARPEGTYLELVHRLDRETSGLLMLAKRRRALVGIHEQMREGRVDKRYMALVLGRWPNERQHVHVGLTRYHLASGERRVRADPQGTPAHSVVTLVARFAAASLLEVQLKTGRTHQIRVHLAHLGYPIVGDDKYGDFAANRSLARADGAGFKRMFLHAASLSLQHPGSAEPLRLTAPLPAECAHYLEELRAQAL